jgi:osmoprotectant transport system substrate-binding protein
MLLCMSCIGGGTFQSGPEIRDRDVIRIASFDFSENELLAELYAEQLRNSGLPVEVVAGLGTRELVEPALEQDLIDLVIDYSGTLLDFLGGSEAQTHATPEQVYAALQSRLAGRGLTALRFAQAEDANGFAVTTAFQERHGVRQVSDLRAIDDRLTFGGPPECPARRYCLRGLQDRYRLSFAAFRSEPTRATTATALETGEIDVGMLETTDGRLASGRFVVLADDAGLQPRENVVPVVRSDVLRRYGSRLSGPLDAVTARLTTRALISLNREQLLSPDLPAEVAAAYLPRLIG